MKAIVCSGYGSPDVLKITEMNKPVPGDDEVLIRIHSIAVTSGDCKVRSFKLGLGYILDILYWFPMRAALGFTKPRKKVLGFIFAGEIAETGKKVKLFKKGERVFGSSGMHFGTYAEYLALPESSLITHIPDNKSYEEAAAIPFGALAALKLLEKGKIKKGHKVLINGASGAVGTAAVELAKYFGAEVTGICSSVNAELVKSLGAERVIDYTHEDFTAGNIQYDLIFDTVIKISKPQCKKVLKPGGIFVSTAEPVEESLKDLEAIRDLFDKGVLQAVIDRRYPFEEMAEAHRYVDKGHKKGNVIVNI